MAILEVFEYEDAWNQAFCKNHKGEVLDHMENISLSFLGIVLV